MIAAAQDRRAARRGEGARPRLVAEQRQRGGRRADERDPRLFAGAGEIGVLRQEAVAGVDRVALALAGPLDDLGDVEICGGADPVERDLQVGVLDVLRGGVVAGVDRGGGDLQFGRGAQDADGDFAAVGDEQSLNRHGNSLGPALSRFVQRHPANDLCVE